MGFQRAEASARRFSKFIEGLASVIGHADRAGPLRDYCMGLMMPCERKSVEPMAAVTAPARTAAQHQSLLHFVGEGAVVGRAGAGQGARDGAAGDRAARADRGVDHRRHGLSQEGPALGRGGAAVLRPARQAGQLPGGGVAVAGQSPRQPAGGLSAVSAARIGRRTARAAARPGCPRRSASRPSRRSRWSSCAAACEAGLPRGVVLMDAGYGNDTRAAHGGHRAGPDLRRRHLAEHHGVGARHGTAAAQDIVRPRAAADAAAPRRASIGRSRSRSWRSACPTRAWRTITWREGYDRPADLALCARCACAPPIATTS